MPGQVTYQIDRSPFFRLRNKRKLARLLGVSQRDFPALSSSKLYRVFTKKEKGRKPRRIEEPLGSLKRVHQRIHILLSRIQPPNYLFSGRKRISSIDNAKHHLGRVHSLTVDVEQFFPNCRSEHIFRFFRYRLLMDVDVAHLMTKIASYEDHVPTGSALSQSIAYWAYSRTFDAFSEFAIAQGMSFSLYVDDMTFTSPNPIPASVCLTVDRLLNRIGLRLKASKSHRHSKRHYKVVTGTAISPAAELRIPNRIRQRILKKLNAIPNVEVADLVDLRSVLGSLSSARQIEPDFFEQTFRRVEKALASRTMEAAIKDSATMKG